VLRAAHRLLLAAALVAAASFARADVYRWVDESGNSHYATSLDAVPRSYRSSAQVIPSAPATVPNPSSSRPPPPQSPPPRAAQPAPAPAPVEPPPPVAPPPAPAPTSEEPSQPGPQTRATERPAPSEVPAVEPAAPAVVAPATPTPAPAVAAPSEVTPAAAPPPAPLVPQAGPETGAAEKIADPRQAEIAEIEAQIERDREVLRKLISMPRWDSSELASDPQVREISERLPRLQAELAALRSESGR
jgi:hypothetical protein